MSAAPSLRCLLPRRLAVGARAPHGHPQCHAVASFHSSSPLEARKSRFKSISAERLGLTNPEQVKRFTEENFVPYTPEEIEILKKHYSTDQMEAVEAGEAAIDPRDLTIQGRLRRDPYAFHYLDDFSRILPSIDKRPKTDAPPAVKSIKAKFVSEEQEGDTMDRWAEAVEMRQFKEKLAEKGLTEEQYEALPDEEKLEITNEVDEMDPTTIEQTEMMVERSMINDDNAPAQTALAPELGKNIPGVAGLFKKPLDPEDAGLDDEGIYQDLKKRTGLSVKQILAMSCKLLVVRLVTNQTRLGKIRSSWVLAVAGNGNGRLGIGEAKSTEHGNAVRRAKLLAIRDMQPIRRYEDRTIYGRVEGKFGSTVVKLEARPPGFGLRASHRLFEMFRLVGLRDMAASMPRARNPMNSVKACFAALTSQRDPEEIASGRGKKLVDVRKVYYDGNVL